jgi:hypothetical protein
VKELFKSYAKSLIQYVALTALLVVIFPGSFLEVDARSAPAVTMRIQIDDSSPAMVAVREVQYFEQIVDEYDSAEELNLETRTMGVVTLNSGHELYKLFQKPDAKEVPQNPLEASPFDTAPELSGIQISASADSLRQQEISTSLPSTDLEDPSLQQVELASASMPNPLRGYEVSSNQLLATANFENSKPDFEARAQSLVNEALKQEASPTTVAIPTSSGQQILVMAPKNQGNTVPSAVASNSRTVSKSKSTESLGRDAEHASSADPWGSILEEKTLDQPYLLSGTVVPFQPLRDDNILTLEHVVDGEVMAQGKIWNRDLRYEIAVNGTVGYLLAKVENRQGEILQEGKILLDSLEIQSLKQTQIASLTLKLNQPDQDQIIVAVESGYSFADNTIGVPGATVYLQPFGIELRKLSAKQFVEDEILIGSNVQVEATADDHWPTLALISAGKESLVRVFHDNLMHAFLELINFDVGPYDEKPSVVWGVVKKDGAPVANAQVEVESYQNGILSYFRFNLPDTSVSKTDSSGQFVWASLGEGQASFRVTYEGVQYPAQVLTSQRGKVNWIEVNFESRQPRTLIVESLFEAQPLSDELGSSFRLLGSDKVLDQVNGTAMVKMVSGQGRYLTEMDAGYDFVMSRAESSMSRATIQHILVDQQWLSQLKGSLNVSDNPESGSVVGRINENVSEVYLYDDMGNVQDAPIYINSEGQPVEDIEEAVAYVYLDVLPGQYTTVELMTV